MDVIRAVRGHVRTLCALRAVQYFTRGPEAINCTLTPDSPLVKEKREIFIEKGAKSNQLSGEEQTVQGLAASQSSLFPS
jgi:hypothetical protein